MTAAGSLVWRSGKAAHSIGVVLKFER